jgi:hypothetical protein
MTEEEWSSCVELKLMTTFLSNRISNRKNRLFNVACCRRVWHLLRKKEVEEAILTGERYADGQVSEEELRAALRTIHRERSRTVLFSATAEVLQAAGFVAVISDAVPHPLQAASSAIHARMAEVDEEQKAAVHELEVRTLCDLVREICGNPFRDVSVQPAWLSPQVRSLSAAIYNEHSFEAMPILGDALEEAGCTDGGLLEHCRAGGPHYRGCWLLDLLLGKR